MTNLVPVASQDPVYQLETTDIALAGSSPSQTMNRQAQALLNRQTYFEGALSNPTDPIKGTGMVGGSERVVDTVANLLALTGAAIGSKIRTRGYYAIGDGGENSYTVISITGVVADGGRFLIAGSTAFRGEFPEREVSIMQFGSVFDGIANDTTPFISARTFARTIDAPVVFKSGTCLLDPIVIGDKDVIIGQGIDKTTLKFTAGAAALRASSTAVGTRHAVSPDFTRDWEIRGFTIDATGCDFGLYTDACLFSYVDEIQARNATICNIFLAYSFRCRFGRMQALFGKGTGFEIGYNHFSWTPSVAGEPAALMHGNMFEQIEAYGNGTDTIVQPAISSFTAAGVILADGLSNSINLIYSEQNIGKGLITTGDMASAINSVYLEHNDNLAGVGTNQYQMYNDGLQTCINDLGPIFTGLQVVYTETRLFLNNYRSTAIEGPGPVKINGYYRNATITTPSTVPVPIFTRFSTKADLLGSYTLPKSMPADTTRQFFRTGLYRVHPEITVEETGNFFTRATIQIIRLADSVVMYTNTPAVDGPVTPGQRITFADLDFPWDSTQTYRLVLSGIDNYAGKLGIHLYGDLMI